MNRFFSLTSAVYEAVRSGLDIAFGHPNGKADTCMPPEATAPTLPNGRKVAAILAEQAEWPEVAGTLAALLANGDAVELTAEDVAQVTFELKP